MVLHIPNLTSHVHINGSFVRAKEINIFYEIYYILYKTHWQTPASSE